MSTAEDCWRTAWLRGGRISEVAWISQDALVWCSGIHLIFLDVATNKLLLPRFSYDIVAAGASCVSGHLSHRLFAFSEKIFKPRIFIYAYPSMLKISEVGQDTNFTYIATAFVGDFIVSLSSIPDFKLTIWSWRTGDKITSVKTFINDSKIYGQTLKPNFSIPSFVAQVGNESAQLCTWEMTICNKTIVLNGNKIMLPKKSLMKDVAWSPDVDDVLAIVDRDGHIYISNSNGTNIQRMVLSNRFKICTEIEPTSICWYQGGLILRTTFFQICYYKETVNNFWQKTWTLENIGSPFVLTTHPYKNNLIFYFTLEGRIAQIVCSNDNLKAESVTKHFLSGKYIFADFIQPKEDYVAALDICMEMSVIEVSKGAEVAMIDLAAEGKITFMISHPQYPLIVITSDKGELMFVSFLDYLKPKILGKYHLQFEALDIMKFSRTGRFLVVGQKKSGVCYLLTVSSINSIEIRTRIEPNFGIVDMLLFDYEGNLKLYILERISAKFLIGNKLIPYELFKDKDRYVLKRTSYVFIFTKYYEHLYNISDEFSMIVGTPYLSKHLNYFKINHSKDIIYLDVQLTGHHIRQVKLFCNNKWLITCGLDRIVTLRNIKLNKYKNEYLITHHRHEYGVVKSIVNSNCNVLITVGVKGSIICTQISETDNDIPIDDRFKNFYEYSYPILEKNAEYLELFNEKEIEFLTQPIRNYMDSVELQLTWAEWNKKRKTDEEKKKFHAEKEKILLKLKALKQKIALLLNKNETAAQHIKLPMSAFSLDKYHSEKKMKSAKDEREEIRLKLESDCNQMERVIKWIQTKFWESQETLGQSICGIFNDTEVGNYAINIGQYVKENNTEYSQFENSVFKELMDWDNIYPWEIYDTKTLQEKFNKQVRIKKTDIIRQMNRFLDNFDDPEVEEEFNRYLLEGITTFNFIQPIAPCFSQFKAYSYTQLTCDHSLIMADCKRLRFYFNKQFDEMFLSKQREMNLVRERTERIHYISYELESMFNVNVYNDFEFPKWHSKEKPETVIDVTESEISVKPYISRSLQELYDKQAAEVENARLAMMADDFHERAVQTMMDGVLEIRWEDQIKKDVPLPQCMIVGKKVEEYVEEDVNAVKRYEANVKSLQLEREKYRKILQTDYAKISQLLTEGITKFNSRLREFHQMKMKVESAIQQLNLHYIRRYKGHVNVKMALQHDDAIKKKIMSKNFLIEKRSNEINVFESVDKELHQRYENLTMKDKYLEKKFKYDFPSLGKNSIGVLFTYYKKRPRIALKNATNFEVLDLGKSIVTMKNLPYLTSECLDYLHQLAMLDVFPTNLPPAITLSHWQNFVAIRRLKIDHELKLRATEINLEKAAEILANYNQKVLNHKLGIEEMNEQLKRFYVERTERALDAEIQLVIKMGQVEVKMLQGDVKNDMKGAIVVRHADVEMVNNEILTAGENKLKAIRRNLDFRRDIEVEQWVHDCMKTRVRHREVDLYFAKTAALTREMRDYLLRRSKGLKDDKTPQRMNREFQAMRRSQEKVVKNFKAKEKDVYDEILRVQKKNEMLDKKITRMNIKRCEMELQRNLEAEIRNKEYQQNIVKLLAQRSAFIRKLMENYELILEIRKERDKLSCIRHPSIKYGPENPCVDDNLR